MVRLCAPDARGHDQRAGGAGSRGAVRRGRDTPHRVTRGPCFARCIGEPACQRLRSPRRRGSCGCSGGLATNSSRDTCWQATSGTSRSRSSSPPARSITRSTSGRSPAHSFRGASSWPVAASTSSEGCARHDAVVTGEKLLWLWTLVVLGFFSIARFKLDHYIFPAAPACCLIAAHALARSSSRRRRSPVGHALQRAAHCRPADRWRQFWRRRARAAEPCASAGAFVLPFAVFVGGVGLLFQIGANRLACSGRGRRARGDAARQLHDRCRRRFSSARAGAADGARCPPARARDVTLGAGRTLSTRTMARKSSLLLESSNRSTGNRRGAVRVSGATGAGIRRDAASRLPGA